MTDDQQSEVQRTAPNSTTRTASSRYQCPLCGQTFTRAEHLSRHQVSHANSRPFCCATCGKSFSRTDSLARHMSIHQANGSNSRTRTNQLGRVAKACTSCARQRLRCDGQDPCARCVNRDSQCIYLPRARRRIAPIEDLARVDDYSRPNGVAYHVDGDAQLVRSTISTDENGQDIEQELSSITVFTGNHTQMPIQSPTVQNDEDRRLSVAQMMGNNTSRLDALSRAAAGLEVIETSPESSRPVVHSLSSPLDVADHGLSPTAPGNVQSMTSMLQDPNTERAGMSLASPEMTPSQSMDCFSTPYGNGNSTDLSTTGHTGQLTFEASHAWEQTFNVTDWMAPDGTWLDMLFSSSPSAILPQPPYASQPSSEFQTGQTRSHYGHDNSFDSFNPVESNLDSRFATWHDNQQRYAQPARTRPQWPTNWDPAKLDNVVHFPDMNCLENDILDAEDFTHVEKMSLECYTKIARRLNKHTAGFGHFQRFHNGNVAPLQAFDNFIQLYFEYFHPALPLLHQGTFDPSHAPWQLVLATAAVGCRYSRLPGAVQYANGLQELLRRVIADTAEGDNSVVREPWFLQCMILNSFGMTYSGNKRMFELAEILRNSPATMSRRNGSLTSLARAYPHISDDTSALPDQLWKQWICDESTRRMGFIVFLLDAGAMLHFGIPPCMAAEELNQTLPVHERLWEASSADEWLKLCTEQDQASIRLVPRELYTVESALSSLRERKPLPPSIGDFARLVLVFAAYRHATALQSTVNKNPFCTYARNQGQTTTELTKDLETVMETLQHVSAQQVHVSELLLSSLQSHMMLVLMLLHAPRQEMLRLAHAAHSDPDSLRSQTRLMQWMTEDDGRTARMAVGFAGGLLATLRRAPTYGFHAPTSLHWAILVLWTFNQLGERVGAPAATTQQLPTSSNNRDRGSAIRLDRLGKALLEIGTLSSAEMRAWHDGRAGLRPHLQGLGNICRPSAGPRLLEMASAMLRDMRIWPLAQGLAAWLCELPNRNDGRSDT